MYFIRNSAKNLAFELLNYRRQRGFHLMNDLKFWSKENPIEVAFDVGANIGQTVSLLKKHFPKASIEAFEPIETTFDLLKKNCKTYSKVNFHQMALGSTSEVKTIQLCDEPLINSILNEINPIEASDKNIKKQSVKIETVDNFCRAGNIVQIDFLKTDTEGFDLEVLKGAKNMLKEQRINFVLSEVNFNPYDNIQTYFCDLHEYMNDLNYRFVGLYDCNHILGVGPKLGYCNALYYLDKFVSS